MLDELNSRSVGKAVFWSRQAELATAVAIPVPLSKSPCIIVEDVDAHYQRAVGSGAKISISNCVCSLIFGADWGPGYQQGVNSVSELACFR